VDAKTRFGVALSLLPGTAAPLAALRGHQQHLPAAVDQGTAFDALVYFWKFKDMNRAKLLNAKLCIIANGCHENHMDAELLKNYLTNEFNIKVVDHYRYADCIKVSTGCTGKCSYCSIRVGRGKIKSKTIGAIVKEFNKGIALGYKHFGLIGTDLGDYGKDINSDLYELLNRIVETKGDYKIKLRNVSPRWLIPNHSKLILLLKSKKFIYLQSPIQSGSDDILKLINAAMSQVNFCTPVKRSNPLTPSYF
jgi:tRNA A37 methylthiotransferase MiaB